MDCLLLLCFNQNAVAKHDEFTTMPRYWLFDITRVARGMYNQFSKEWASRNSTKTLEKLTAFWEIHHLTGYSFGYFSHVSFWHRFEIDGHSHSDGMNPRFANNHQRKEQFKLAHIFKFSKTCWLITITRKYTSSSTDEPNFKRKIQIVYWKSKFLPIIKKNITKESFYKNVFYTGVQSLENSACFC